MNKRKDANDGSKYQGIIGLTAREAFSQFVLADPKVVSSIERAVGIQNDFSLELKDLEKWYFQGRWPLVQDPLEAAARRTESKASAGVLGARLNGKPHTPDDIPAKPEEVRACYEAVLRKYEELIDLFRAGKLTVEGYRVSTGAAEMIDPSLWGSSKLRLDIKENELGEGRGRQWTPKYEVLKLCTAIDHPLDPNSPSQSKGGRPQTYLWDSAFECLAIRLGTEGLPETGEKLAEMYLDAFEDLGKNAVPDIEQVKKHLRTKYVRLWSRAKARS
ncbi:MAG: hypothetical protein AAGE89_00030 [Pseudomonadota bacterium]